MCKYFFAYKIYFMNIRFLKLLFIPAVIVVTMQIKAQDPHYSQFSNTPLLMNPALTSDLKCDIRALTNYRSQWKSISVPYNTFTFSYDMGIRRDVARSGFLGAGIVFTNDKAGDTELSLNQVNLSLAYHLRTSMYNTFSVGILGGYAQRTIKPDKFQWDSQFNGTAFDPNLPSNEPSDLSTLSSYADFGAGISWNYCESEKFIYANNQVIADAGIAVFHVNRPDLSFYTSSVDRLPMKVVIHASSRIGVINKQNALVPVLLYMQQGPLKNINAGLFIRNILKNASIYTGNIKGAAFSFGSMYRVGDAVIPQIQFEYANFALGLSYDVNVSGLTRCTYGRGGFEISLRFLNPNPFTGQSIISRVPSH